MWTVRAILLLSLLILPQPVAASFAEMPLSAVLAQAELVVVGTLQAPDALPRPTGRTITDFRGTIVVHRQLAGPPVKGRCVLTWTVVQGLSSQIDHRAAVGQKGIWLLQRQPGVSGRYVADHPACVRPMSEVAAVEAAIKGPLFLVHTPPGKELRACCLTLEIRTFLPRLEVRDFVSTARGKLQLHGRTWLEVQGQNGKPLAPRPGRIVRAADAASVVVTRERPHRVEVDLRRAFDLRRGFREVFHLAWGVSPRQRSPSYSFQ